MGVTSGKGRLLQGSPADRVKRQNITEFRGTIWEAVNDWFFGVNTVDYDWNDANDANRVTKWIYTQDGASVSAATVDLPRRRLDIGLTTGANDGSNQRELYTIPETAPWGVSHVLTEIKAEAYGVVAGNNVKPQHGLGLNAQEDIKRRAIMAWHDVVIGNPHVINIGVWQGNLDGTDFENRGGNVAFDLGQRYTLSSGSRTSGVVTATCTAHGLFADEYLDITWTREFAGTSMTRTSNVVTATVGIGHLFETGDAISVGLSSPSSFDGSFTITGFTGTTITWSQTAANDTGTGTVKDKSSDVTQVKPTIIDVNTIQYPDARHDKSSLGTATDGAFRKFPYFMEVRVAGTIVWVRCWDRSQAKPDWVSPGKAIILDLDKANRSYSITASSRAANVATLTIGAHDVIPGNVIDVTGIADGSFNIGMGFVTAVTATTVDYPNTGANTGSGGSGTMVREGGSFDVAGLADIPTPRGSGRIAIVNSHAGLLAHAHTSYGDVIGANSFEINFQPTLQVTELETAQAITRLATVGQATETETATLTGRSKVRVSSQAIETETATTVTGAKRLTVQVVTEIETATTATVIKTRTLAQTVEIETATQTGRSKVGAAAQASEIETATTSVASHARTLATALETETATTTGRTKIGATASSMELETAATTVASKQQAVTQAQEIETAGAVTLLGVTLVAQATETETAMVVAGTKIGSVQSSLELETATVVTGAKSAVAPQVTELETAAPITGTKTRVVAQSTELETATATGRAKQLTASQASEIETGTPLARRVAVAQAVELETANIITRFTSTVVGQALETEIAQSVTGQKIGLAGQVIELESAQVVQRVTQAPLLTAIEQESSFTITGLKQASVGSSIESELATPVGLSKSRVLNFAEELELAVPLGGLDRPTDYQPIGFQSRGEGVVLRERRGVIFREGEHIVVTEGT